MHLPYKLYLTTSNLSKSLHKEIIQVPEDLVTFTEETLKGKLAFLCSVESENILTTNRWVAFSR